MECSFNYETSLLCCQVKHLAGLHHKRRLLKASLSTAKTRALQKELEDISAKTPAFDILRRLRPFIGPSNLKKFKHKPLPLVRDEHGQVCTLPNEALGVWIRFFQDMECGRRMSFCELRKQWIEELRTYQTHELQQELSELPTLTDLEIALRRVPCGRSCGPDGIPGEVCHHFSTELAKHLYPQLLKAMLHGLHGQEYLGYKGGRLTPAYKGRGPVDCCASYRSLLVSCHIGKALHRTIRDHHSSLYHGFLQRQQTGGRKHVPVQLAMHQLRAFQRHAKEVNVSTSVLYLDLTEAFYRIVRELPLGGELSDLQVAHIMRKLKLPADSLHHLHALLREPCALQAAGMSDLDRKAVRAIHTSTHFWMHGQTDVSRTTMGSRPGDCFADWLFAFTWSTVLHKVESFMRERDLLQLLPDQTMPPLFGCSAVTDKIHPFIGPNWMDDLALCMQSQDPAQLVSSTCTVTGFLLDLCREHCLSPNLSKGKTELQFSFRGAGSRRHKVQLYGPSAAPTLPVLGDDCVHHVPLVRSYKHLGGSPITQESPILNFLNVRPLPIER